MALVTRNQQNNWVYVLLLAVITAAAAAGILYYSAETIQEINSFSQVRQTSAN